jgi:hypothetical protein
MNFSHTFKETDYTPGCLKKFLSALWVAQEITKLMSPKPQYTLITERPRLQELRYGDVTNLQAELEENNRLMFGASSDKSLRKRSRSMPELGEVKAQPVRIPPSEPTPPKPSKKTFKNVAVGFLKACRILKQK